jgi:hypothetical protein
MSYRRVRSYRRIDARRDRDLVGRQRPRRVTLAALLAVALAGMALIAAPHVQAMLTAASKPHALAAAGDAGALRAPAKHAGRHVTTDATGKRDACAAPAAAGSASTGQCTSLQKAETPAAAGNTDCEIIVPAHPLTAAGLATPYQLTGPNGESPQASGCTMANAANLGAFVQATILDAATGKLSVYEPLVITKGTRPAAAPVLPTLPQHAVVTIDFGFNGSNLTQVGATPRALIQGHCLNGTRGSIFGQVSFCHGTHFFWAARRAESQGRLTVPAAGTSPKTGQPCPTTRSFTMIDQDQSDNVTTQYLLTATGQTAQFSQQNVANMPRATVIGNGSDNALLAGFLDPVLGCQPFTAPDLSRGGAPGTSQALDELSAIRNQAAPVALVPENDPMVLVNNGLSATKTNRYRDMVGQPEISAKNDAADSPANYCKNMMNIQAQFLNDNEALLASGPSPVPSVGNNLLSFMANRLIMSYVNLNCGAFGVANPVHVTLNNSGVATSATFGTGH